MNIELYYNKMNNSDINYNDLKIIKVTPMLRNIYSWTAPFGGIKLNNTMSEKINKITTDKLKYIDIISSKYEKEFNKSEFGSILFTHQRDEGLIFWCHNKILNKNNFPQMISWPKNSKLIDTFLI